MSGKHSDRMSFLFFFLLSIALALAFIQLRQLWLSAAILIGFALYAFFRAASATFRATKTIGKSLASGIRGEVGAAQGSYPPASLWKESMHDIAGRAGEQAFAPDAYKFTMKNWGQKTSKAVKKLLEAFKKMLEG